MLSRCAVLVDIQDVDSHDILWSPCWFLRFHLTSRTESGRKLWFSGSKIKSFFSLNCIALHISVPHLYLTKGLWFMLTFKASQFDVCTDSSLRWQEEFTSLESVWQISLWTTSPTAKSPFLGFFFQTKPRYFIFFKESLYSKEITNT